MIPIVIINRHPDKAPDLPELLTVSEVRALLKTSRSWVYDAVRLRRLPHVRLGGPDGPIRFLASDIAAHIRGGRIERRPDEADATPRRDDRESP
jgi:excisionase family DNA binding protein